MKMKPYTIESTGITIVVPGISLAALTMQLKREMPSPQPPLIEVNIAGIKTVERNSSDPDYLKAYVLWEQDLQVEATDRFLKRIALRQHLNKEQKQEVSELREALAGERLPANDKLLWFYEIAIGSDDDIRAIMEFSQKMKEPQEDRVASTAEGFSS